MLQRAHAATPQDGITYSRADLDHVALPPGSFDVVYSSLAFHYLTNLPDLVSRIHGALVTGGRLLFSVEHPIVTAPHRADWLAHGDVQAWPVDYYFDEGARTTDWLVKGVVKQHRTIGTYLNMLIRTGFTIAHVEDWAPTEAQVAARPEWATERHRPLFLLVAADRQGARSG